MKLRIERLAARLLVLALILTAAPSCRRCGEPPPPSKTPSGTFQGGPPPGRTAALASRLPAGPLVLVQAPDLAALVKRVKDSERLGAYLGSDSFQGFTESRLFSKLEIRFREAANLAQDDAGLADLAGLAGSESALALYDIGEIGFVYLSRVDHDRFARSLLGAAMPKAAEDSLEGSIFYVLGEGGNRLFFALTGDWLVASNQDARFKETLERLAADRTLPGSLAESDSFAQAFPPDFEVHDLALFLDQEALNQDSYFKRYWIMNNVGDLDWVRAVVVDLDLEDGWRERRFYSSAGQAPPLETRDLAWTSGLTEDALFGEGMSVGSDREAAGIIMSLLDPEGDHQELADLLAPALPVSAGQTARLVADQKGAFSTLARAVVIRFERSDQLDPDALRKLLARDFGRSVLIGDDLELKWSDDQYGHVLALPLLGGPALWMNLEGTYLVVSNQGMLHREVLTLVKGRKDTTAEPALYRSRWDLERAREGWRSMSKPLLADRGLGYDSRNVLEKDLPALFAALGGGSWERQVEIAGTMLTETVTIKPEP